MKNSIHIWFEHICNCNKSNSEILFRFILLFSFALFSNLSFSQCGSNTPTFTVDLTCSPTCSWLSPNVNRNDQCCGQTGVNCIKFIVTLGSDAAGVSFGIFSGAVPSGALNYQVNCGPPNPVGSALCLSGPGPHVITFCKPGGNSNVYQITSIPAAVAGTDITVNQGCIDTINASGFNASTAVWNSIYPGIPGSYNSFLSCTTGCLNPIVTGTAFPPPYVDYQVCGIPAANCNFASVCDTVRVTFHSTLLASIIPQNPTICFGQTSTTLTANGSGGTPPYNYLWNNVNPSQSITVGTGTYTVKLSDASGCPPTYSTVTVTSFSVAISANAGTDKTVCRQSPITSLNGSVTGASGGTWSGGGGSFSPNNTTLSGLTYTPTAAELAAGFADLALTTTGNGTCPPASDIVRINYENFTGTVNLTPTPISCFGGSDGAATIAVTGGSPPHNYSWNTVPAQTGATAINLGLGTYTVITTNSIGCTSTNSVTITQPTPVALASSVTHVSCSGGNNGVIVVNPTGGTAPYTYLWQPGNQTTSSISGIMAGSYTVTVKDAKLCTIISNFTVTQPAPLSVSLTPSHVSCYNGSNGSSNSAVAGGTAPYTYNWTSGATSPNANGLFAGTYSLTVTDSKGCTTTASVTINQPTQLFVSVTNSAETCNYLNNGSATAIPTGGTAEYTYLWQPGTQTTSTLTNLSSGTYTVTVTDSKGCTSVINTVITEPSPLTIGFISQSNVSCKGGNDGTVTANPLGGTSGYTYSWMPGNVTTAKITNVQAGSYTVTVTDTKGCTAANSLTITEPTALTVSATANNETCNYLNNGTANGTAAGGTPGYSYLWKPGLQTSSTISGLAAGTYTLQVTDAKGCIESTTATVSQPAPVTIAFASVTNVSCFAGSNGTATASPAGGTPGYSYLWMPGAATNAAKTGLPAGTYTVTVTDNNGCSEINTVTITQPDAVIATTNKTNETCSYLNNGTATAVPAGGTPGYTYLWQPGALTNGTISNLAAGTYSLTITDSKGCPATTTAIIAEPAPVTITFNSQVNVSCFAGNNGSVAAAPAGGTPNYAYSWIPGSATTNSISNLAAGTYSVTVTDSKGCMESNTVSITQPAAPLSVSTSFTAASCFGTSDGSVTASGAGGTSPYSYLWDSGNLPGATIAGLPAETYSVVATDAAGCTATNFATITQPSPMVLVTSSTNSDCGLPNGQTAVSVSGGLGPFTYLWSPAGGTNNTATGLLSGAYTVVVTDVTGCTASQFGNVNENSAPAVSIFSVTNVSCYGGSNGAVTVVSSGGIGPYTYSWLPGGGTDSIATGLTAGSYTVTVTGSNGCQSLATTSPDITEPPAISIDITNTAVSCFGGNDGSAVAIATGGIASYTYEWLSMGVSDSTIAGLWATTYTVQVTDANNCIKTEQVLISEPGSVTVTLSSTPVSCFNGTDGTAGALAAGGTSPYSYSWMPGNISGSGMAQLPANTYTVSITDANGCSLIDSVTVIQATQITTSISSINSNCGLANGQASVAAAGGTPAYTYLWTLSASTNATATALMAGSYTVTVTDNKGCAANDTVVVSNNASPVANVAAVTNVTCFGANDGTATVNVTGNAGPYIYLWSPSGATTATATGLATGTQTVVVTDTNACQSAPVVTPEITQPDPLFIAVNKTSVSCFGSNDATANATASGGTAPYTYMWMPGGSTSANIINLAAGTYTIQVTDNNSCVENQTVTILQPALLTSSMLSSNDVNCFGDASGTATVAANGGSFPYNYAWMPSGGNGSTETGLPAGTYTVTITDDRGCTSSSNITINQPSQALSASSSATPATCNGADDGIIAVQTIGGTPGYTYQWNPSAAMNDTATGLAPGYYIVTVTDNNGCQTNTTASITEPAALNGTLSTTNPTCSLLNGSIVSLVSGGISPYTYFWQENSATTSTINDLGAGSYNLTTTDASGCMLLLSASLVTVFDTLQTSVSITDVSCYGGNDGMATIAVTQGTAPYTISWMPYGGSNATAISLDTGIYVINVTDASGCQTTATALINEPASLDVSVASLTNVLCNGGNTGSVSLTVSGGTGPLYSYAWTPAISTSAVANNLSNGTYTVNVTDQNSCSKAITAAITEPAALSSIIDSINHAICYHTTGSASVLVTGGTAPYSYSWTAPANLETGSTAYNLSAGSYSVTVTDSNGCETNNTLIITAPAQVVTTASPNDTICLGQTSTISATATGGTGTFTFAWQPSGAINNGTLSVSPASAATYTVVAYDQNGCPGSQDIVRVIPYNLTSANINALGNTPICPGQSTYIYAEASGDTGPLTYQWNNGLGAAAGAFQVIPSDPTSYIVDVTNSCGITVSDTIEILFNPPPIIDFTSTPNAACTYAILQFNDNSVPGNPNDSIVSWIWNFGDGTTSSLENPTHSYTIAGNYSIMLTVITTGGCTNTNSSVPFIVTAYPSPTAVFSMNSTYLHLPQDVLQLSNQSVGASSYFWDFGDGGTSTLLSPIYTYNAVGIFQIQLISINQYGCADTATAELTTDADIIFPNAFTPSKSGPTGGTYDNNNLENDIFFPYTSGVIEYDLQVFNRWGELIFESFDVKKGWDGYYRGQLCQQDVYVWKAYVKLNNGKVFNKAGDLTLIE